jgi:RNA polymerase sigma-70 factor (ECF subfamily)
MKADPDADLVLACQQTDLRGLEGPFKTLYDGYRDRVYNVCYRITGNATDALDASQETFGILFRKLGAFRFESRFSSWVYRVAVNASIDLKRRTSSRKFTSLEIVRSSRRSDPHAVGDGVHFDVPDERVEMPIASASRHELEDEIQRAIDRLSPKLRGITVLRYIESLSYEEIAQTLEISLGTVKSRLARAHEALDRELAPLLEKHYLG